MPNSEHHHKKSHIMNKTEVEEAINSRVERIDDDFKKAFNLLKDFQRSVTFLGSAQFTEDNLYYGKARELAKKVAKELNYTIFTGGGGGIMEAANRGASEAGGQSVGIDIQIPVEQKGNPYVTRSIDMRYFFSRKMGLTFGAEACVFLPGGYGTLNEFFEIITLVKTQKVPKLPIILYGSEFWNKLDNFIKETLCKDYQTIKEEDIALYTITDDDNKVIEMIRKAPIRNGIWLHD